MPKAEAGTAKWLSNKMKAKGLQKLRWYCQMCQKQCRDENGFKCHVNSESHQRQLLVVADDPEMFLDEFSKEFEQNYTDLLRRRFGTKRVQANMVYQEYIAFREHVHMNATTWETLTDFVKYLGRSGKCLVDNTEKGWFVTWIDRDPETLARQERLAKKQKMDKDDDERMAEFVQKQLERAKDSAGPEQQEPVYTELSRKTEEEKVEFRFDKPTTSASAAKPVAKILPMTNPLKRERGRSPTRSTISSLSTASNRSGKAPSALDEIRLEEERRRESTNRRDYWLHKGIVVKISTKKLGTEFYKQKAVVIDIEDSYTAVLRLTNSDVKIKADQAHLETVIPNIGRLVLIVNGAYRGCKAVMEKLNENKFSVAVEISEGPLKGRRVENLPYEDVCKLHMEME